MDEETLKQYAELLEDLLTDMTSKQKEEINPVIKKLKNSPTTEELLKIQDDLESFTNSNIDNYTRTEIMNVVTEIEGIVNS